MKLVESQAEAKREALFCNEVTYVDSKQLYGTTRLILAMSPEGQG